MKDWWRQIHPVKRGFEAVICTNLTTFRAEAGQKHLALARVCAQLTDVLVADGNQLTVNIYVNKVDRR